MINFKSHLPTSPHSFWVIFILLLTFIPPFSFAQTIQTTVDCNTQTVTVEKLGGGPPLDAALYFVLAEYPDFDPLCDSTIQMERRIENNISNEKILSFSELGILVTPGCDCYIATAKGIRIDNKEESLNSCIMCPGGSGSSGGEMGQINCSVSPVKEQIQNDLIFSSIINIGLLGDEGCLGASEHENQIRNTSSIAYDVGIDAEYVCSTENSFSPCSDPQEPMSRGEALRRATISQNGLGTNLCLKTQFENDVGTVNFPKCCDGNEVNQPAVLAMQCANFTVTKVGDAPCSPAFMRLKSSIDTKEGFFPTFSCGFGEGLPNNALEGSNCISDCDFDEVLDSPSITNCDTCPPTSLSCDNCPCTPNTGQRDFDQDGLGDACDPDFFDDPDGDGVYNPHDNCPTDPNSNQFDSDEDGFGDVCDPCPNDPQNDSDLDGICGDIDNCPTVPNSNQQDTDGDGIGDVCDSCPNDPNDDIDADGICGDVDNCPTDPNPNQDDQDRDGMGDVCDPDDDNDGVLDDGDGTGTIGDNPCQDQITMNCDDNCQFDANPFQEDTDLDLTGDACELTPVFGTTLGGTEVTIFSTGIGPANPQDILFDGTPAKGPAVQLDPDSIKVFSPPHVEQADILVTFNGKPIGQSYDYVTLAFVSSPAGTAVESIDTFSGNENISISTFPQTTSFEPLASDFRLDLEGQEIIERDLILLGKDCQPDPMPTNWKLFSIDPGANQASGFPDPVILPDPARAVAMIEDNDATIGVAENEFAFVPLAPTNGTGQMAMVDLSQTPPQWVPFPSGKGIILGMAFDIALQHKSVGGQERLYAYITSDNNGLDTEPASLSTCSSGGTSGPQTQGGIPLPDDDPGGGGGFDRDLYISVMDVTPPNPPGNVIRQIRLSSTTFSSSSEAAIDHMGLDFNTDGSLLYIVNPDTDEVFIYDTVAEQLLDNDSDGNPDTIPVGDQPSDLAIATVEDPIEGPQARAYVTNELDNNISVIKLLDNSSLGLIDLPPSASSPVAIATRTDGLRAYTVNSGSGDVTEIDLIIGVSNPEPILIEADPRGISIQKVQ